MEPRSNAAASPMASLSSVESPTLTPANSPTPVPEPLRSTTRLQHGIRRPKHYTDGTVRYNFLAVNGDGEPSTLADALGDKNWKHAMDLEFSALQKNKTWHIVPCCHGKNIIDCNGSLRLREIQMVPLIDIKVAWSQ
jgi:hypothetical protein